MGDLIVPVYNSPVDGLDGVGEMAMCEVTIRIMEPHRILAGLLATGAVSHV